MVFPLCLLLVVVLVVPLILIVVIVIFIALDRADGGRRIARMIDCAIRTELNASVEK
jgi:hypothetical protein